MPTGTEVAVVRSRPVWVNTARVREEEVRQVCESWGAGGQRGLGT